MAIRVRTDSKGNKTYCPVVYSDVAGHQMWLGTFQRERDAKLAEAKAVRNLKLGEPIRDKDIGFSDLADEFMGVCGNLAKGTQDQYRISLNTAKRHFKNTPISQIGVKELEKYITKLSGEYLIDSRTPDGEVIKKTRAPGTVRKDYKAVRLAMDRAVAWGHLRHSPAKDVKNLPTATRTRELRILTIEEHKLLISKANPLIRQMVAVWPFIGLRLSEMFGLRWQDVDLKKRQLHVRQQIVRGVVLPLKTKAARRTVPLSRMACTALSEARGGIPHAPGDLVFPSATGKPFDKSHFYLCYFNKMVEEAKTPGLTPHAFRHTCASWLLQVSSLKNVQEVLGHANASTTLALYTHLLPHESAHAADKLDSWYGAPESFVGRRWARNQESA